MNKIMGYSRLYLKTWLESLQHLQETTCSQ